MLDRKGLVHQMAKAFAGESLVESAEPTDEELHRASNALVRVELFLGVGIDEARAVVTRVLEDVS